MADLSAISLRIALIPTGVMPFLSAAATNCAASIASPTMWRAIVSSQLAACDGEAAASSVKKMQIIDPSSRSFSIAHSSYDQLAHDLVGRYLHRSEEHTSELQSH